MASFSGKQRAFCIREYYHNNDSSTLTQQKICSHYNIRHKNEALSIKLIKKWLKKFEEIGSIINQADTADLDITRAERFEDLFANNLDSFLESGLAPRYAQIIVKSHLS